MRFIFGFATLVFLGKALQRMEINSFLTEKTPLAWLQYAATHLETLLLDHAHCEKKAAQSALHFILRYPSFHPLVHRASRFAREELRHFEQVYKIMRSRNIELRYLTPSRYAKGLQGHRLKDESGGLLDNLIIAAFIEARSCERFQSLLPFLDAELSSFYRGLFASEQRHFLTYLELAESLSDARFNARVEFYRQIESELITSPDEQFRFHSGVPSLTLIEAEVAGSVEKIK